MVSVRAFAAVWGLMGVSHKLAARNGTYLFPVKRKLYQEETLVLTVIGTNTCCLLVENRKSTADTALVFRRIIGRFVYCC